MTSAIGTAFVEIRPAPGTERALARDIEKAVSTAVDKGADEPARKLRDKIGGALKNPAFAAGIGGALGNITGGILARAGDAVKSFATGSVDAFAAVEDATGAAGVQFGDALPKVLSFADRATDAFGLSKRAAIDAQNSFGTLGKSAGLAGEPLAQFAGDLTGLAGDLASFKGTSTEQAIEAVGAALRGESEPIRAYGVLLDDATLRNEALKMGLIKTTKQALTPQQKVLAAQSAILKQTTDAQGDFARTSDSTANTQKRQQAATENASAALGEKLAPAVTAVREVAIKLIDKTTALISGFQSIKDATPGPVLAALAAVIGTLTAITATYSAVVAVQAAGGLAAYLKQTKLVTAATKVYTAVQAALNLVMSANPIALVVLAVAALVAGLVIAYRNSETFRNVVNAAFRVVGQVAIKVIDGILFGFEKLAGAAGKLPGPLGAPFRKAEEAIKAARGKLDGLSDRLDSFGRKKASPSITIAGVGAAEEALIRLERRITNIGGVQVRVPVRVTGGARQGGVQARALGGPVNARQPYLVGERGPELVIPRRSGRVLDARRTAQTAGGSPITNNFYGVGPDVERAVRTPMRELAFALATGA